MFQLHGGTQVMRSNRPRGRTAIAQLRLLTVAFVSDSKSLQTGPYDIMGAMWASGWRVAY
mgnify:CR=1 FL=1